MKHTDILATATATKLYINIRWSIDHYYTVASQNVAARELLLKEINLNVFDLNANATNNYNNNGIFEPSLPNRAISCHEILSWASKGSEFCINVRISLLLNIWNFEFFASIAAHVISRVIIIVYK